MTEHVQSRTFFWVMTTYTVVTMTAIGAIYTSILETNKELEIYKEQSFQQVSEINTTVGIIDANLNNVKEDVGEIKDAFLKYDIIVN